MFLNLQESWAICRIFKKTNATAQRALSHSWVSPLPETTTSDHMLGTDRYGNQFSTANMLFPKKTSLASQFCTFNHNDTQHSTTTTSTPCPIDILSSYNKPIINPLMLYKPLDLLPISNGDLSTGLIFSCPLETSTNSAKSSMDVSSLLMSTSTSVLGEFNSKTSEGLSTNFGGLQEHGYQIPLLREMQGSFGNHDDNVFIKIPNVDVAHVGEQQSETVRSTGFPISIGDAWKPNVLWDSSSLSL